MKWLIEETMLVTIGVVTIIAALIIGVTYWWYSANTKPVSTDTQARQIEIQKGTTFAEVAQTLQEKKIIKNAFAFRVWAKLSGDEIVVQPGTHEFSPSMDLKQVEDELATGYKNVTTVQIREGLRVEEIADIFASSLDQTFDKVEFLQKAKPLEGMLFPDTYEFEKKSSADDVIKKLNDQFETNYASLNAPTDSAQKKKIVTIASLLEREGKSDTDRPVIAGIIQNRLNQDMPLQIDATVQYAIGARKGNWWSSPSPADTKVNSPYNTYQNVGLPPSPICNPGLSSLKAAANPQKNNYFYYIHDAKGNAYYARTLEEHNRNVAKYL